MLKVTKGNILKDVLIISPYIYEDFRGSYVETYNEESYTNAIEEQLGKNLHFIQDDISVSKKNVVRGLHGDYGTWKLIQCLYGSFYLAVVDVRKDSPTYLKWETFVLDDRSRQQILAPAGFVNGHLCLSDMCIFSYKQSTYYKGADKQITMKWDDPDLGIPWPVKDPILSERDRKGHV